ncbi:MAG TPA: DedA family protein [Stellaceae bacterium]|jgi:membrane protein DedA with SNARE-associated domain
MHIHQLIAEHGAYFYLIVFVWTYLEGETIVLFAGFAAAQGLLRLEPLILAACLGSFAGDQTYFWLGRHFGQTLLRRFPRFRKGVNVALRWLERYSTGFILTFRFIYGVRNFSSFALGVSAVGWRRFLWLNLFAAALWTVSFVALGYFLGHAMRKALPDVARSVRLSMLAGLVVVGLATWLLHWLQRRRQFRPPSGAKYLPDGD